MTSEEIIFLCVAREKPAFCFRAHPFSSGSVVHQTSLSILLRKNVRKKWENAFWKRAVDDAGGH
jgi:hypothetical protein